MSSWWLLNSQGEYQNTKTGKTKAANTFKAKNGFSANNVRGNIVKREVTSINRNGTTVKSYRSIDAGSFSRPEVAIKSLATRNIGAFGANVRMLFQRTDGTYVWASTGYVGLRDGNISMAIGMLIGRYGNALPTYIDIDIIGGL